jgi:hypothetical protein
MFVSMKMLAIVIFLLFSFGCMQSSPTPVIEPTPVTKSTLDVYSAGGPGESTESTAAARIKLVEEAKMQFLRSSISVTISGAESDVMNMESAKLSTPQIAKIVRPRLKDFASAGFTAINIVDARGEKQTIPVTAAE